MSAIGTAAGRARRHATALEPTGVVDEGRRGLITAGLMTAAFLGMLDSTVVNVSLPHIQGSLSASAEQITWVLTSYVIAAAIMTAPVGWLAARFGRKQFFIL